MPDADRHEIAALPVDMKPMVFSYTVRYNFEYGFERVTNARGALGGMAARVMLYNGETPDDAFLTARNHGGCKCGGYYVL